MKLLHSKCYYSKMLVEPSTEYCRKKFGKFGTFSTSKKRRNSTIFGLKRYFSVLVTILTLRSYSVKTGTIFSTFPGMTVLKYGGSSHD